MNTAHDIARIQICDRKVDPSLGQVRWSPQKSAWIFTMYFGAIIGGPLTSSGDAFLLFVVTSIITLCAGHSVGMHRRLIHNSFACPLWLEYGLVYCGTLIGLAGPFSIIRMHELRDWAQRQPHCHDYFASRQHLCKDWFWLLHCDIHLQHPPAIRYERRVATSRFYKFLEKTRFLQQVPWGILFYIIGGWSWVIWGICMRVSVCVTGHWLVGYFAHRWGDRDWHIEGAGVQGYNVQYLGLLTMGECWHNNHHAFPNSARLGHDHHQADPGWWLIRGLQIVGLAWNIQQPQDVQINHRLKPINLSSNR